MRAGFLAAVVAAAAPTARPSEGEAGAAAEVAPATPTRWIVLETPPSSVRTPFVRSPVLLRHVLRRDAPGPREGDVVTFDGGVRSTWTAVALNADGSLPLPGGRRPFFAAATVTSPRDTVVLARAPRASLLLVNGTPYPADHYDHGGWTFPVHLRAGENALLVAGAREGFSLRFSPAPSDPFPVAGSACVPDVPAGEESASGPAGILVWNPATEWRAGERLRVTASGTPSGTGIAEPFEMAPLAPRRVPFPLPPLPVAQGTARRSTIQVGRDGARGSGDAGGEVVTVEIVRRRERPIRRHTFVSAMDGAVQPWAEVVPLDDPGAGGALGTVLSLHGAAVDCMGQASSYDPKPDFRIACPTNRGAFGFDWQDWGRRDAYEVLDQALRLPRADPRRVYLTGHSMGGHGTWHLAANDPDRWLAAAPSAGWRSFDTYASGRPDGAREDPWLGADGASLTETLLGNLVQVPLYILHGTEDDNVPASEAEAMVDALEQLGAPPRRHFEPGAGHWWERPREEGRRRGALDWPGFFDLFREHPPRAAGPAVVAWRTADPSVDADHHWLRIEQPERYGSPSEAFAARLPGAPWLLLRTLNVRRLSMRPPGGGPARAFLVEGGRVRAAPPADPREKSPERSGPAKAALRRRFVFVPAGSGTAEESLESLDRARHDAATWTYRAHGDGVLVRDAAAAEGAVARGRDVILYGNRDTNAAWARFLGGDDVFDARRGAIRVGDREFRGDDLGAVVVRPRADDPAGGLVVVLADSGPAGTRLGLAVRLFVSGVGYPDWCVFSPRVLVDGPRAALAAGWFDHRWEVQRPGQ